MSSRRAVRHPFLALALGLALLACAGAAQGCGKCIVDCADGYEPIPNTCACRPILDAGATDSSADTAADAASAADAADTLASCLPGTNACGAGSTCIQGCPNAGSPAGVCSVPGRDSCGCGSVLDPCNTPGTVCLTPACCDYMGICVTTGERAAICARPEGAHFDCTAADPSPCPLPHCRCAGRGIGSAVRGDGIGSARRGGS